MTTDCTWIINFCLVGFFFFYWEAPLNYPGYCHDRSFHWLVDWFQWEFYPLSSVWHMNFLSASFDQQLYSAQGFCAIRVSSNQHMTSQFNNTIYWNIVTTRCDLAFLKSNFTLFKVICGPLGARGSQKVFIELTNSTVGSWPWHSQLEVSCTRVPSSVLQRAFDWEPRGTFIMSQEDCL